MRRVHLFADFVFSMIEPPNKRAGGDGGISRMWHAERARPAASEPTLGLHHNEL